MKINMILFNRGSGGNFLARALTLDPLTVCLGAKNINSAKDRCDYYCYKDNNQAPNTRMRNGLSVWVNDELNNFYFPFTRGFEELVHLNQIVVEPVHFDHYIEKIQLLGPDDTIMLYYIDTTGCEDWVFNQVRHKISSMIKKVDQQLEIDFSKKFMQTNNAQPISLMQIIESESTFVDEYNKICQLMNLNSYPELALKIYKTWKKTWSIR